MLVIDDTGDRKDGTATAHVARQYLGSVGKVDNGIVAVTSLWADERCYYPLHVVPYTPAPRLPGGRAGPGFRTKPQLAVELVDAAQRGRGPLPGGGGRLLLRRQPRLRRGALGAAKVPFVLALKPRKGTWAPADEPTRRSRRPASSAGSGPAGPGGGGGSTRRFRDGHTETWWAADAQLRGCGPDRPMRLVVATHRPGHAARAQHLVPADQPAPARPTPPRPAADLAEIVRLYGLRNWVEQGYKQVKGELGWADFQVRIDRAIRRHWALVCCAFSLLLAGLARRPPRPTGTRPTRQAAARRPRGGHRRPGIRAEPAAAARGRWRCGGAGLADPLERAAALLAVVVASAAAPAAATAA